MPPAALALVLVAALLHALWNIVAKQVGGNHHFVLLSTLMTVGVWLPVGLWFGVHEWPRWGALEWLVLLASSAANFAYFIVLLTGYRKADLTVVYPVARGSAPLLASLGAVLVLGEAVTALSALGIAAVCGGVFLVAGGPRLWRAGADARSIAGLRWGAATGALIALYTVIDGVAVKLLAMGPVLLFYTSNLVRLPLQLPLALRDRAGFRSACRTQWRAALVVGVLAPLAYVLVLYALTMAPLSHVAPTREVSMLFAALIGGRLLGEGDRAARVAGAACIAGGVIALALA